METSKIRQGFKTSRQIFILKIFPGSHSWGEKLQGSLQLDMSYATISIFGQQRKLYRETSMKYMVSSAEKPHNFHIYSMHSDMDSFIMYNSNHDKREITSVEQKYKTPGGENIFHESL